jgi:hypothetical protein
MNSDQRRELLLQSNPRTIREAHQILKLSIPCAVEVLRKAGRLPPETGRKRLIKIVETV